MVKKDDSLPGAASHKLQDTTIGCIRDLYTSIGLSALFGAVRSWLSAKDCALPSKVPVRLCNSDVMPNFIVGWAERKATWSISHLPDAPQEVPAEMACLSRHYFLLVSWRMPCSKTRSAPQAVNPAVHLSRKPHPTRTRVPHTPPNTGGCFIAAAPIHVHRWHTRGVRAVYARCTPFSHSLKAGPC